VRCVAKLALVFVTGPVSVGLHSQLHPYEREQARLPALYQAFFGLTDFKGPNHAQDAQTTLTTQQARRASIEK